MIQKNKKEAKSSKAKLLSSHPTLMNFVMRAKQDFTKVDILLLCPYFPLHRYLDEVQDVIHL